MAVFNILTINSAGTTIATLNLATNGNHLLSYKYTAPQPRSIEYNSVLRNGSNIALTTLPDVTEGAQFLFTAASATAMAAQIHSVERIFLLAAERQRSRRGNRYYIEVQLEGMPSSFRSEIKRGMLSYEDSSFGYGWIQQKVQVNITFTRTYYFESTTKTELYLKSALNTRSLGGVTIYNQYAYDVTRQNWIEVLSSDMVGVLDTPVELLIKNTYNNITRPNYIAVGQKILGELTNFDPTLESEEGSWTNGTATTLINEAYSATQAKQYTWTGSNEQLAAWWTLDTLSISYFASTPVRFFAKFIGNPSTYKFTMRIKYQGLTLLDQTNEVRLTSRLVQDLGVMQIPPWLQDGGNSDELVVQLYVRNTNGGSFTLDYIFMMPLDGYTEYRAQGYGLPYNFTLKDNAPEDRLVVTAADALERGFFIKRPREGGILIRPNTTQRLYFLQLDTAEIDRTMLIQAFYRERRLTV